MYRDPLAAALGLVFLMATHSSPVHSLQLGSGAASSGSSSLAALADSSSDLSSSASDFIERDQDLVEEPGDPASEPSTPNPCADSRSRDFDFWIGEWDVFVGGDLAGHNSIRPLVDGCVLHENWRGAQGGAGTSLNFYNTRTGLWQQFWVWRNGTTLELAGTYRDGRMVLEGESLDASGARLKNRVTWFANEDGTVRQLWEVTAAGAGVWRTVFDGHYRKSKLVHG